ncbi:MAG TPA: radical SAM protein [Chryseosolibacter sp.]
MNSLGLIVKATRQCNLRCTYCHDWRARSKPMPFNVLATLIKKAIETSSYQRVDFIWHGGEPLLLGRKFFEKALLLQQKLKRKNQVIRNSLQTNGTLLNEEWCEFFTANNFHIGVSLDGPPELHNRNRKYASGKNSFEDVKRGIELLKRHQVQFGVLMVLNHSALELEVKDLFEFFTSLGAKSFSFLPARPDNIVGENTGEVATPDYVNPEEFTSFMKRIFNYWYALDNPQIQIREITSITQMLMGGRANVCTLAGQCIGQYFHVEANGDLYHCDKYLGDTSYFLGNIVRQSFSDICTSEKILALVENEKANIARLQACPYFHFCNGGCPHDRYVAEKNYSNYDNTCCGQRDFIEHINSTIVADLTERSPALLQSV